MTVPSGRVVTGLFVVVGGLAYGGFFAAAFGSPNPWHEALIGAGCGLVGWMISLRLSRQPN